MRGGAVEMGVADAQAAVGSGEVGSPVALWPAQCLTEHRDHVLAVDGTDAAWEEPAEFRVGQQPCEQAVDGSGDGGPPADRLVDADRLFGGGPGVGMGARISGHGRSPLLSCLPRPCARSCGPRLSNECSFRAAACPRRYWRAAE